MLHKRLKSLLFVLLTSCGLAVPALAAGTTPLALVPQVDLAGNVAAGCLLYFYTAGTVATPQNAYADFGLTQALPNPVSCDQSGRVPMHWLADGLIHIRLTDSTGVVLIDTTMQVLGPSSGGGGGGSTVDPTTILATGDEKIRYGKGTLTGFVRENGLTIGNAVSGATERANADTQALFIYLYAADPNLVVSGGRTGNALNDYNANKTMALPDMRGRINAFLDDMGNSPAGRLTSPYFSSPTTLGAAGGNQVMPGLTTPNLPPYTPSGSVASGTPVRLLNNVSGGTDLNFLSLSNNGNATAGNFNGIVSSFTGNAQGGASTPFGIVPPIMLRTQYIKL